MSTLPQATAPSIFWVDGSGQQQGPELLDTVVERIIYQQIPSDSLVWWAGAEGWIPFNQYPHLQQALEARQSVPADNVYVSPPLDAQSDASQTFEAPIETPFETSLESPFAPDSEAAPLQSAVPNIEVPLAFGEFTTPEAEADPEPEIALEPETDLELTPDPATEQEPEPDSEPATATHSAVEDHGLDLGDEADRCEARRLTSERAEDYRAQQAWVASLSNSLPSLIVRTATTIGLTVQEVSLANGYHVLRATTPDATAVTISVEDAPVGASAEDRLGRPLSVFVDQSSRAHAEIAFGDYLAWGSEPDHDGLHLPLAALVDEALHAS